MQVPLKPDSQFPVADGDDYALLVLIHISSESETVIEGKTKKKTKKNAISGEFPT